MDLVFCLYSLREHGVLWARGLYVDPWLDSIYAKAKEAGACSDKDTFLALADTPAVLEYIKRVQ